MLFLFGSERPCFPFSYDGGAERTTYTIIEGLLKNGIEVVQICTLPKNGISNVVEGICSNQNFELFEFSSKEKKAQNPFQLHPKQNWVFLKKKGHSIIAVRQSDFYPIAQQLFVDLSIDLLVTHLKGSDKLIEIASSINLSIIHRVFGVEKINFPKLSPNTVVLANSPVTAQAAKKVYKYPISFIYSPVNFEEYKVRREDSKYVTLINPREEKGIHLFCDFVKLLPQIPFLVVKGWGHSKFQNREKQALNFLKSLPNVTIINAVPDIREVYQQTKILVAPSRWIETFGRIVIEAQINGIPVIASKRGNLPLTVGEGGYILQYGKPKLWAETISNLYRDERLLEETGSKAINNVTRFEQDTLIQHFIDFFINTVQEKLNQSFFEENGMIIFQNIKEFKNGKMKIEVEKWKNGSSVDFSDPLYN